jgi:hypothetical protein
MAALPSGPRVLLRGEETGGEVSVIAEGHWFEPSTAHLTRSCLTPDESVPASLVMGGGVPGLSPGVGSARFAGTSSP